MMWCYSVMKWIEKMFMWTQAYEFTQRLWYESKSATFQIPPLVADIHFALCAAHTKHSWNSQEKQQDGKSKPRMSWFCTEIFENQRKEGVGSENSCPRNRYGGRVWWAHHFPHHTGLKYSRVKSKLLEFQDAGLRRLQIDGRKCPENLPMTFAGELPEFYTSSSERAFRKTRKIDRIFIFHLYYCNIKVQNHDYV